MPTKRDRWLEFLSERRIGDTHSIEYDNYRSPYQRDRDVITFSECFRKLQGKTQVFSLTRNDYIRNRLTHSLEVASVGRSLAEMVGEQIIQRYDIDFKTSDFSVIVESACLAHDVGHPPLAHSGEESFKEFFNKHKNIYESIIGKPYTDFLLYEGNAQNIRILTDTEQPYKKGALRLTSAVLGAMTKYPRLSHCEQKDVSWCSKKFNFFTKDKHILETLSINLKLKATQNPFEFHRSPLAYLVEAADDICYSLVDIEDAYIMKAIDYQSAVELLSAITGGRIKQGSLSNIEYIQTLRGKAIGKVIREVTYVFLEYEDDIINGNFNGDLLDYISVADSFKHLVTYASQNIYVSDVALEVRTAGYNVIEKLLELFIEAAMEFQLNNGNTRSKSMIYIHYMPKNYRDRVFTAKTSYEAIIAVTDYVSSMTDKEALMIYQNFLGASIPTM